MVESRLHAVERIPSEGRGKAAQFIPIRFVFRNKLTKDDKLLLAFEAFVLSEVLGREVSLGKIIHGGLRGCTRSSRGDEAQTSPPENSQSLLTSAATHNGVDEPQTGIPAPLGQAQPRVTKVKTPALAGEVRKRLGIITALLANPAPPDLVLNRHCAECEFQARCRKIAVEKDDLSLLANMSAKERQKLRSKGIFTVTQLSYTFRPRRRPKRPRDMREKYHHALKALAIREQKIHIVGSPELKIEGTPVYLDVEGLPDRDFYYLIGVRIGHGDSEVRCSIGSRISRGTKRLPAVQSTQSNQSPRKPGIRSPACGKQLNFRFMHSKAAAYVIARFQALGLEPPQRLKEMHRVLMRDHVPFVDCDFLTALESLRDLHQLLFIFEQFEVHTNNPQFKNVVKHLLNDSALPQNYLNNSPGRDHQFELYLAAICQNAGLVPVDFGEPDITCFIGDTKFGIAAKRLKSRSILTFKDRVLKAADQLKRQDLPGIIALDLTLSRNRRNRPIISLIESQMYLMTAEAKNRQFCEKHGDDIRRWVLGVVDTGVKAVLVIEFTLRLRPDDQWGHDGMLSWVPILPGDQQTDRLFESFYERFLKGVPNLEKSSSGE